MALVCKEGTLMKKPLYIQRDFIYTEGLYIYTEGPLNIKKGADLYTRRALSYIYTGGPLYITRVLVYKEGHSI
jgi:hypothetical protein